MPLWLEPTSLDDVTFVTYEGKAISFGKEHGCMGFFLHVLTTNSTVVDITAHPSKEALLKQVMDYPGTLFFDVIYWNEPAPPSPSSMTSSDPAPTSQNRPTGRRGGTGTGGHLPVSAPLRRPVGRLWGVGAGCRISITRS